MIEQTEQMEHHHLTEQEEIEFYGEKPLRWYQVAARNATAIHLANGVKRIIIHMPTGAGKTLSIAATMSYPALRRALGVTCDRPLRVLFIAHRDRLLTQAERTFTEESNVNLILQSAFSDIPTEVINAGWDVCVIDECHHEAMASIQYHLELIGDKPIIGLTATPDRPDGLVIKFEEFVAPISREQAVAEGWLAETDLYSFVDVPTKDKTDILKEVFDQYAEMMGQTMVFVKTRKEVAALERHLQSRGYDAVGLLQQNDQELNDILDEFSAGKHQFIINCGRVGEGVDVKGCTSVVLGRQLGSYVLLNQIIGRAARPDSDCQVFELINPLSGRNLDTTVVVGTPRVHKLVFKKQGQWKDLQFDYTIRRNVLEEGRGSSRWGSTERRGRVTMR
jgi:superfamily II DNA or RNA helicase